MNETKAARFQRGRRRAKVGGVVSAAAVLVVLAFTPAGAALAAWTRQTSPIQHGLLAQAIALLLYTVSILVIWEIAFFLALIALAAADSDTRGGRLAPWETYRSAQQGGALLAAPIAFVLASVVLASAWIAGPAWWMAAAAAIGALLVSAMHLAPALMARAAGAQPINRPALVERLGALARRVRVPIQSIDVLPASSAVTTNALVAGAGDNRRVFVADAVIRDWSDDEIEVVVAHELAHHVHRDLWSTLVVDVTVLAAGFWSADRVRAWIAPASGSGLAMLPMLALVTCSVWIAAAPFRFALSRWQERRADAFALNLTGRADAFQTAIRRLAISHLAEERPSRLTQWLYHRHPSVAERLSAAESFQRRG
jgi:STE24 endopeptidase